MSEYGQFNPVKQENLARSKLSLSDTSSIEKLDDSIIIFDKLKSCLFLNLTDSENYEDRLKILSLSDWILHLKQWSIEQLNYFQTKQPSFPKNAALFLNIERFKLIERNMGLILGNSLLAKVAQRISASLRERNLTASLESDKLTVLLYDIDRRSKQAAKTINWAAIVAEKIDLESIVFTDINEHEVYYVEASIGIAFDLVRDADSPNIRIQNSQQNEKTDKYNLLPTIPVVRPRNKQNILEIQERLKTLYIEQDLKKAIANSEFVLHYQPIVSLTDEQISGVEVFVCWQHPVRGLIYPQEFIYIAERTGLIIPLGLWAIEEACYQLRTWQLQYKQTNDWQISINIAQKQLLEPHFVSEIKQILQKTKLKSYSLKLEINENTLLDKTEVALSRLEELKAIGIKFGFDNLGTSYSCLNYLHQFSFDTIKINRLALKKILNDGKSLNIVRAIVAFAHNLDMYTVAKDIDTDRQLAQFKTLKFEYGQGDYIHKPLDKTRLEASIATVPFSLETVSSNNDLALEKPEKINREKLLTYIEYLQQELLELKNEKFDLKTILDNTVDRANSIELQLNKKLNEQQEAQDSLLEINQELERLIFTDSLTQIANRRQFDDYLLQQWQKLRQESAFLSLILCDIDYFKVYNDTYGHLIGDYCLQQVALSIESVVETYGGVATRYGGEEFGIILPNIEREQALIIANEIRLMVKNLKIEHHNSPVHQYVTLSLGVYSLIPNSNSTPELAIAMADKALYEAKKKGRDRAYFVLYSDLDRSI